MELSSLPYVQLLHPKMIHFPIALFIGAMGMEVLSLIFSAIGGSLPDRQAGALGGKKDNLHRTALHMYIFATVITPFVVLTGLQEADHLHLHHPVLTIHKNFALLTMWGSLGSLLLLWLAKKKGEKILRITFIIFLLILATFVSIVGYNGGRMVYEYGVGMEQ